MSFEGALRRRLEALGVDGEVFGPYVVGLLESGEERGAVATALGSQDVSSAAAEELEQWCREQWTLQQQEQQEQQQQQQQQQQQVQFKLQLRQTEQQQQHEEGEHDQLHADESPETRRRRQELVRKYDGPDALEMDSEGRVVVRVQGGQREASQGLEGNDNAERVRLAELQRRQKQKEEAAKMKQLSKTSAYDGKKKKAEAKEKRQQKAKKVERKRL